MGRTMKSPNTSEHRKTRASAEKDDMAIWFGKFGLEMSELHHPSPKHYILYLGLVFIRIANMPRALFLKTLLPQNMVHLIPFWEL